MSEILTTMARQAERNETLLASHIRAYADRHDMDWAGVARQLALTSDQLSRLALCRVPRRDRYAEDVDHIAEYVDIESATLAWFLEGAASPSRGGVRTAPQNGKPASSRTRARRTPIFSLRRLGLAVAFLALAAFLGAFVLTGTRQASAATLVVNEGETTLISQSRSLLLFTHQNETQIVSGGTVAVSTGDAIGVPLDGSATLRLNDGSTVDLDGGTIVEVSELVTTDEDYRVRLNMMAGRTVSRVRRVLGAGDAFEIGTPSSTASVRGTVFTVEVIDDETTYVAVSEGTVWFEMDGETVELHEGDEITGQRGQPLTTSTQTPTAEPTTAEPTTAAPTTAAPTTAAPTETPSPTSTPIPTVTSTAEPELAAPATTQPPAVQPADATQPAVVPTDPPASTEETLGDTGDTTDETIVDPTDPPPADPTDPPPADPTDPPPADDGGNPNDDKDGDPDDGNAGIGNDEDKDDNPDDGNNGIGNDADKDSDPDDGNNGIGDDNNPAADNKNK
jgi:ferric-dicitrate binding protein FerR (iron transport regulator)